MLVGFDIDKIDFDRTMMNSVSLGRFLALLDMEYVQSTAPADFSGFFQC